MLTTVLTSSTQQSVSFTLDNRAEETLIQTFQVALLSCKPFVQESIHRKFKDQVVLARICLGVNSFDGVLTGIIPK